MLSILLWITLGYVLGAGSLLGIIHVAYTHELAALGD